MSFITQLRYGLYRTHNYCSVNAKLLQKNRLLVHNLRKYNRPWAKPPSGGGGGSSPNPFNSIHKAFQQLPAEIKTLIYANSFVFMLFQISPGFAYANFTMKRRDLSVGRIYTPISSIFGHFSLIHFAFNMIMLYFYGPMVLGYLGAKRFYSLYLLSGGLGSIAALFTMASNGANLGASGSIFGLMGYATMRAPHSTLLLYGLLPMKLWQLMALIAFIEAFMLSRKLRADNDYGYSRGGSGISHEAHLTGIGTGLAYYYMTLNGIL